jgi:hypothetical protein
MRMRSLGALVFFALVASAVHRASAAETGEPEGHRLKPVVGRDLKHDSSPPLFLVAPKREADVVSSTHEPLPLPKAHRAGAVPGAGPAIDVETDALGENAVAGSPMPPALVSFDGVNSRNGVAPPDTNGDVGPNHYVQWVNFSYAVWSKQGSLLYGPVNGNTLWSGFGGMCETRNNGDPIVLYDPIADRWFLSQLAFIDPSEYHQCIAVSQTADPTGPWYRYDFLFSTTMLNDYPKFGVWPDGYYLGINQYVGVGPRVWAGQGVMAFERDKMLQGLPAQTVYFNLFGVNANYGGAIPVDLDGPVLPPVGAPNVFVEMDDNSFGWTPIDRLSLWKFHVDWTTPSDSTFGVAGDPDEVIDLSAAGLAFDSNLCGYASNCVPQLGTTMKIAAMSDRLMYRAVYRRWADHESLTLNHTIDVDGADHAGVRWYELRNAGGPWAVHQAGTYAPDALHRWMASAAMDGDGDFAIGYSVSHESLSPSIRYAGRTPGDPPGTLPWAETSLVAGAGAQTGLTRWGDYSMLSVDPVDDCTFWYTQEYYTALSNKDWTTRVGSFRFPGCVDCRLVGGSSLTVEKAAPKLRLSWTAAANATQYDVVAGSLMTLRSTAGDFGAGTTACLVNDAAAITVLVLDNDPAPGDGTYYLVRPIGTGCRGTYDDGSTSQQGGRDAETASAPIACP